MTLVAIDATAENRLHELGLTADLITRALLRADAEARLTTGLEPPTAEGTIRYLKTVRFLREELLPMDWDIDNYKHFCRTIHPSREFSIVTSSGDEFTGVDVPGKVPCTKYPKGDLTALAVYQNAGQGVLDLGPEFDEPNIEPAQPENIWFLLQCATPEYIYAELSIPTRIEDGMITDWEERIILPRISRQEPAPTTTIEEPPAGGGDAYSVDVAMR